MAITGTPAWMFPPNWDRGVLEKLEWKTDLLSSNESSEEMRVSRRVFPRRSFEATFLLNKRDRQYFDRIVSSNTLITWLVPLWHDVSQLQAAVSIGGTVLSVDTTFREYDVFNKVVLRGAHSLSYEAVDITSLTSSTITLTDALVNAWPVGTFVYPAMYAYLLDIVKAIKKNDELYEVTCRFDIVDTGNTYPFEDTFALEFDGTPVLTQRPDDSEDLEFNYEQITSFVDNGLANPTWINPSGKAFHTEGYRWSFKGREANHNLRKFLYYLRGRNRAMWVPTFMSDLTLISNITSGDTAFSIRNIKYAATNPVNNRKYVFFQLHDGTVFAKNIVASTEINENEESLGVDISSPFSQNIAISDIRCISWVTQGRLDQDSVEIEHVTDTNGLTKCAVTWKLSGSAATLTPDTGGGQNYWDIVHGFDSTCIVGYIFQENWLGASLDRVIDHTPEVAPAGFAWSVSAGDDNFFVLSGATVEADQGQAYIDTPNYVGVHEITSSAMSESVGFPMFLRAAIYSTSWGGTENVGADAYILFRFSGSQSIKISLLHFDSATPPLHIYQVDVNNGVTTLTRSTEDFTYEVPTPSLIRIDRYEFTMLVGNSAWNEDIDLSTFGDLSSVEFYSDNTTETSLSCGQITVSKQCTSVPGGIFGSGWHDPPIVTSWDYQLTNGNKHIELGTQTNFVNPHMHWMSEAFATTGKRYFELTITNMGLSTTFGFCVGRTSADYSTEFYGDRAEDRWFEFYDGSGGGFVHYDNFWAGGVGDINDEGFFLSTSWPAAGTGVTYGFCIDCDAGRFDKLFIDGVEVSLATNDDVIFELVRNWPPNSTVCPAYFGRAASIKVATGEKDFWLPIPTGYVAFET